MSPSRRSRGDQAQQKQSEIAAPLPPASSSLCELVTDDHGQSLEASMLVGMLEEDLFLQDDWWTSSSAAGTRPSRSLDTVVDPFLYFPGENEQNMPLGICSGPSASTNVAAAAPKKRVACRNSVSNFACATLGVNANSKSISSRQSHILSERQRRKGMNHLFNTLAELLPENAPKGDKSTIVSQVILYIQGLQQELEDLSKKQRSVQPKTQLFPAASNVKDGSSLAQNVAFSVCGSDAFVTMSGDSRHSLLSRTLTTLQQHRLEVPHGSISSSGSKMFYYFHVKLVLSSSRFSTDLKFRQIYCRQHCRDWE